MNLNIQNFNQIIFIKLIKLLTFLFILFLPLRNGSFSYSDIVFPVLFLLLYKYNLISLNKNLIHQFFINNKLFVIISILFITSYLVVGINNLGTPYNNQNWALFFGSLYLVWIAYTFSILPIYIGLGDISRYALYSALIHSFIGIIAYILFYIGLHNNLICLICTESPYYSNIPRLVSFTASPNAIAFYLLTCIFIFYISSSIVKARYLFYFFIILICVFLTFSKTLYVFIFLSLIFFLVKGNFLKITAIFLIGTVYMVGTHFYIDISSSCLSQKVIYPLEFNGFFFDLCKTYFYDQKKIYIDILFSYFDFFGLGVYLVYKFGAPHSLLLESLILYGVLGILTLYLFIFYLLSIINITFLNKNFYYYFIFFIIIVSINEDLFRYRELWLFLGLLIFVSSIKKNNYLYVE